MGWGSSHFDLRSLKRWGPSTLKNQLRVLDMNASSWLAQVGERLFGAEPRGIQGMEVVCPLGGSVECFASWLGDADVK